ncbi:MAG: hypothetical protein WD690_03960 [Vicinamibacterales bacterium]
MKNWTPDASDHFESWLGRVRRSVAGDPAINPDDVTQDLRAHVHAELSAVPEPVTVGALDRVLDSLGNPSQWSDTMKVPAASNADWFKRHVTDVVTEWQKALAGEWGMPVLLAVLTLLAMTTSRWIGAPLLLLAYFMARSHVVYAPHALTGRRTWLVYMPLAIGAGLLAGMVLAFPFILWVGTFRGPRIYRGYLVPQYELLWAAGAWWMIVGVLTSREPKRVQAALRPFADGFEPAHGRFLMLLGAAFLITATVILIS